MATMIVRFRVRDFDHWKAVFDGMAGARREHGIAVAGVHRDAADPGAVVTILRTDSLAEAKEWGASPALREAMARGGVEGAPEVWYLEDVT